MSFSPSLSAAEQHHLISYANAAVSHAVSVFTAKLGNKDFFSREDIDDIVGDVIFKAYRSWDRYDPDKAKLSTWVSTIAVNSIKDAVDYRMKRLSISGPLDIRATDDDDEEEHDASVVCDKRRGFNPEMLELFSHYEADRDMNRKDFEKSIAEQVGTLSEKNQRIFKMLTEEVSRKDMAVMEGCTPNAASKRVFDIRAVLRASLLEIAREFDIPCDSIAG